MRPLLFNRGGGVTTATQQCVLLGPILASFATRCAIVAQAKSASQSRSPRLVREVERYHSANHYGIWSELPLDHFYGSEQPQSLIIGSLCHIYIYMYL